VIRQLGELEGRKTSEKTTNYRENQREETEKLPFPSGLLQYIQKHRKWESRGILRVIINSINT